MLGKTLGIELNDGFIRLGRRRGKRLVDFCQIDAPVSDGVIHSPETLRNKLSSHMANVRGKPCMLAVKTSRAILRLVKLRGQLDISEVFPVDISDYVASHRMIDDETALVCCIPAQISENLARFAESLGLVPIRLSVLGDCVSFALESIGKSSLCIMDDGWIYVENGRLKEFIPFSGIPRGIDFCGRLVDRGYNLTCEPWADGLLAGSGIMPMRADELALRGLLRTEDADESGRKSIIRQT